ncbi:MAG TPA: hypothetical protein VGK77_05005 [Candidatus Binatia bacterium]|jgi:hypothetical protein
MLTKELSTVQRVQPYFIEPMYAEAVPELPDGGLWSYEAKFDGYRCLVAKRSSGVVLWSPAHDEKRPKAHAAFLRVAKNCSHFNPSHQVQCWRPKLQLDGRDSAFLTTTVPAVYPATSSWLRER